MFYNNYYLLIKLLSKTEQEKISLAILKFMFDDEEPNFKEDSQLYAVWTNISMGLTTSKKQSLNVQKRYTKKDTNISTNKDTSEDTKKGTKKGTNNISTFYFLISNFILNNNYSNKLENILKDWINYKVQKKDSYTEIGFNKLLSQIKNNIDKFGEDKVINLIDECMASNYQGIIFEKLNRPERKKSATERLKELLDEEKRKNEQATSN